MPQATTYYICCINSRKDIYRYLKKKKETRSLYLRVVVHCGDRWPLG